MITTLPILTTHMKKIQNSNTMEAATIPLGLAGQLVQPTCKPQISEKPALKG